jgi:hypothetical protein
MSLNKRELYNLPVGKLKEIAEKYEISGRSLYKTSNKDELAKKILTAIKNKGKDTLNCSINQNTCEGSSKYKKADIIELARKCGVTDLSGTRKDICTRITANLVSSPPSPSPLPLPVPLPLPLPLPLKEGLTCSIEKSKCEGSSKYKKEDILALAKQCGVTDLTGTRKDLCARIAEALASHPSSLPVPLPVPLPLPLKEGLTCSIEKSKCEGSSKYKKEDILALAKQCGVTDLTGTRKDLCARIAEALASETLPDDSSILVKPLKTSKELINENSKDELLNMCKKIGIKNCNQSDTKNTLARKIRYKLAEQIQKDQSPFQEPVAGTGELDYDGGIPSVNETTTEGTCYGGNTREDLLKLRVEELKKLLKEANIKNAPADTFGMTDYLCAVEENGRCDPGVVDCDGDMVCDADANVCLSEDIANKRNLQSMFWNGKKIIGTQDSIDILKKKLVDNAKSNIPPPNTPPQPSSPDISPPNTPHQPDIPPLLVNIPLPPQSIRRPPVSANIPLPPQNVRRPHAPFPPPPVPVNIPFPPPPPPVPVNIPFPPPPPPVPVNIPFPPPPPPVPANIPRPPPPVRRPPVKPREGTKVIDVDDILRQIQNDDGVTELDELSETKKSILKCLGLIA